MMNSIDAAADNAAYLAAIRNAEIRARYSFFPQHVITDPELLYIAIDEGDYGDLPMTIIDRIVYTEPSRRSEDYYEDLAMRLADGYWETLPPRPA